MGSFPAECRFRTRTNLGTLNVNDAKSSIVLVPGDYVATNINVNFPGSIAISGAGQVRIWVTGTLNLGGNENLGGLPSRLAFLVTSSTTVNVNARGSLAGLIYAPTSVVNVNSAVFGSVVGSSVTLNSGAGVHFDVSSTCNPASGGNPPPLANHPPRPLPLPPATAGCFEGTANGWLQIPCGSPTSVPTLVNAEEIDTPNGASPTMPFQFAQVEATFTAFQSVTDVDVTGTQMTPGAFSLQGNTATFTGNNADLDWVQVTVDASSASLTQVLTRTLAGSCANGTGPVPSIPWPGTCSGSPALLPDTTLSFGHSTGEGYNLCIVGNATALASADNDLVFTETLESTSCSPPACIPNSSHVFVQSTEEDTGSRPINFGTQAFWESPDIFIVPHLQTVTVNSLAADIVLTPGVQYDAYVRVHNDFGCDAVNAVQARVFLADPSALSVPWADGEITQGTYLPAGGITVQKGMPGLLGPFTFTAPSSGFGDGHRCVLADVIASGEPAPADLFDPLSSYQVAQRNLQFDCAYQLTNGTGSNGNLRLTLDLATVGSPPRPPLVPSLGGSGVTASVSFDDPSGAFASVWSAQPGAGSAFAVTAGGGTTTVRLGQDSVVLDPVRVSVGETHVGTPTLGGLPEGVTARLSLASQLTDATTGAALVANGGSCQQTGAAIVP